MKTDKLNENQFGFRPLTSTTAALKAAIDRIRQNKTDGLMTLAVSLDIKAAFDNAWWPALFHRLRLIDCPSNIYGLIHNYTTDRTVTLDHAGCRVSKTMTKGCIQGSACGPILWNIILDELLELDLPSGCRLQAFADDVLLVAAAGDLATLQNNTNHALHTIVSWGKGVKLTFSPTKTQAIAFSDKARHAHIHIDSHALHFQDDIKLLGIILDSKLLFNKHVTHVINKATRIFNKLIMYCRPTWGAHPENIRTIYLQVIQPIITYAAGIWGHVAKKKYIRQKLLSLQRGFAIRAIKAFRTVSTVAAITLARFTPLDLKVIEVRRIEMARLTGKSDFLPGDIPLERHIPPHRLLHPADRITIQPKFFNSQPELSEHLSSLPHPIVTIYTDGSKLEDDTVGAAFVCFESENNMPTIRKFKLHNCCSVFQAELFAILQAAGWASRKNYTHTLILSDSRSAIQATQNRSNTHPLVSKIHNTIHTHTGYIDFAWVKSHADIAGNQIADTMAKLATRAHKAPDYHYYPISHIKRLAKDDSYSAWNRWYNNEITGRYTHTHLPTIDDVHTLFRHTDITFTLTQTLTGHAYNLTYLHRFKLTEFEVCPCDGVSRQTLEHLLQFCPRFARNRHEHEAVCRYLGFSPYKITDLIKNEHCIQSFARLANSILSVLKDFNNPCTT
ncbi:uncharacterized protein LOC123663588 [Melitaea cinxia]|uniref:uncharacterized protein LOC123663588 n=1 Tax=Melitaea cinxia TaxID=113334 RepID=UPI001E26EDD0|nr:uncharacterized protein LOC123663588 [Melitaea cinxia]